MLYYTVFERFFTYKQSRLYGKIMKHASSNRYFAILWTKPRIVDVTLLSSTVGCIP